MARVRTTVYSSSLFALVLGLFLVSLYFFDIMLGQSTKGILFFLRVGSSLMVAIPVLVVQALINTPRPERAKRAETVGLMVVLGLGLVLMMLLLPQMYVGTSWGP